MAFRFQILALAFLLVGQSNAFASRASYRNAHPMAWMHLLPVGETPGWSSSSWLNLELNHSNVWNHTFSFTDRRTGDVYSYTADFEQSSAIAELGLQLLPRLAVSAEVPYANRNGGFLDDFIDQFHVAIGSNRFLRNYHRDFGNQFEVETNGRRALTTDRAEGVGNFKIKMKYWMLKWQGSSAGACDCGLAISGQVKFPAQKRSLGLSSGTNDYSALIHLGAPLWQNAGVWATAGVTKLGANETFAGWPRRDWQQMYEITFDLGIGKRFGLLIQGRAESPLLMREHLDYNYTTSDEDGKLAERVASGWNSLVHWRGSQSFGIRYRWGKGSQVNLLMVEDWGIGNNDRRSDVLYVNNAPDIAFITQWHFLF